MASPKKYSWNWSDCDVTMWTEDYYGGGEVVNINVSGCCGSGSIRIPLYVWEQIRTAGFSGQPPEAVQQPIVQTVRIVVETPPVAAAVFTQEGTSREKETQRILAELDRPVPVRKVG